jgi:hypothetical protein
VDEVAGDLSGELGCAVGSEVGGARVGAAGEPVGAHPGESADRVELGQRWPASGVDASVCLVEAGAGGVGDPGHEGPGHELIPGLNNVYDARAFLFGGGEIGPHTLMRFYILHCIFIPLVTSIFLGVHFWRIRRDGFSGPAV